MPDDFELVDGWTLADDDLLGLLSEGYGRPFSTDWLEWKHRNGPWGRSTVICARDSGGPIGVVFLLPWLLANEHSHVLAGRLVDGATIPSSTRRGVFRAIVAEAIRRGFEGRRPAVVIATATPPAQAAHVKNGATALDPIDWVVEPARPRRAALDHDPGTGGLEADSRAEPRMSTMWADRALRWRLQPSSGLKYEVTRLRHADSDHGVVTRIERRRGVATVTVLASWGDRRECRSVVEALCRRDHAVAVRQAAGPGTATDRSNWSIKRGGSLLCVWDFGSGSQVDLSKRSVWALSGLDLEGVI